MKAAFMQRMLKLFMLSLYPLRLDGDLSNRDCCHLPGIARRADSSQGWPDSPGEQPERQRHKQTAGGEGPRPPEAERRRHQRERSEVAEQLGARPGRPARADSA